MTDERFVFVTDVRDRKRTARGASHKVRGTGKTVCMPSDYMTQKERRNMNVDIMLICPLHKRTASNAQHFRKHTASHLVFNSQAFNISCLDIFGPPLELPPQHRGVQPITHNLQFRERGAAPREYEEKWRRFLNGSAEKPEEESEEIAEQEGGAQLQDTERLIQIIRSLAGTGAKLTIEVTL